MNNDKLKETRPFDLAAAKAGAPYACRNGTEATIVKFDGRNPSAPLAGLFGELDTPTAWKADGTHTPYTGDFDLVMTPLGYIDGRPVFTGDRIIYASGIEDVVEHHERDFRNCRWPEPEKQYPVTGMSGRELYEVARKAAIMSAPFSDHAFAVHTAVANAALRHAIDSGQVMMPGGQLRDYDIADAMEKAGVQAVTGTEREKIFRAVKSLPVTEPEVDQLRADLADAKRQLGNRAARDMAVAEAVLEACQRCVGTSSMSAIGMIGIDLATIIAKVQP